MMNLESRIENLGSRKGALAARKGFTLVELLVAIALFSIAISIAVGGFVRALRTQRQLVALISANSNASLAIEQMAREIRTGTNFSCPNCGTSHDALSFKNASGENVTYALSDGNNGVLTRSVGGKAGVMTAENVRIDHLTFILLNDPSFPPRITISLGVGATSADLQGTITNIETSISARAF